MKIFDSSEMLTVQELAERIKVGRSSIYVWLNEGRFIEGRHFFTLPRGHKRFSWPEVLEVFKAEKTLPTPVTPRNPPSGTGRINLDL